MSINPNTYTPHRSQEPLGVLQSARHEYSREARSTHRHPLPRELYFFCIFRCYPKKVHRKPLQARPIRHPQGNSAGNSGMRSVVGLLPSSVSGQRLHRRLPRSVRCAASESSLRRRCPHSPALGVGRFYEKISISFRGRSIALHVHARHLPNSASNSMSVRVNRELRPALLDRLHLAVRHVARNRPRYLRPASPRHLLHETRPAQLPPPTPGSPPGSTSSHSPC